MYNNSSKFLDVMTSRQKIKEHAKSVTQSKFIFFVRSTSHLEDVDVLRQLVECKKSVALPMLRTNGNLRYMHVMRQHDPKWNDGFDNVYSFYETSLMAGNVTGIAEKFQSGVNFVTLDKISVFWLPLGIEHLEKLQGIENT